MPARHHPPNPWLADQVVLLRTLYTDVELRTMYRDIQLKEMGLRWSSFLCETALREAITREPVLATRLVDMAFAEPVKQVLGRNGVEILADLVQFTDEMFKYMGGLTEDDRSAVRACLEKWGYPVLSAPGNPFIICLPEYHPD